MSAALVGYACCLVSVLGFGSNYIPAKKLKAETLDAAFVFFPLCLSVGVWLVGFVQWVVWGFYKFEPFAMVGGAIWAIGNACVPFIISNCGLGIGQLVWSVTNMSAGWATGTFGLFGKNEDKVEYFALNCCGVLIALCSLGPFLFMEKAQPENNCSNEPSSIVPLSSTESQMGGPSRSNFSMGFVVALIAGVFMGSNFDPPTYLQQMGEADKAAGLPPSEWRHSPDSMHYVFPHFCGILLFSSAYFIVYRIALGRRAYYGREIVIPGILSGMMWGIAQVGWFKANTVLSYVIAFPIIVSVPGVLAAIWGTVLFGENAGKKNKLLLGGVIALQVVGVSLIAVSKGNA